MTVAQLIALARRQALVLLAVFLIVLAVAYDFKKTPQVFAESGTLVLIAPASNPYAPLYPAPLINTGDLISKWLDGPEGQAALQRSGAGAGFDAALANFYSEQFPDYAEPYLNVSDSADSAAAAHQGFMAGIGVLNAELAALQKSSGAEPGYLITTKLVGDSGAVIQLGSSKRVYGGLAILAVIAAYLLMSFADRRGSRLGLDRLRSLRRSPG